MSPVFFFCAFEVSDVRSSVVSWFILYLQRIELHEVSLAWKGKLVRRLILGKLEGLIIVLIGLEFVHKLKTTQSLLVQISCLLVGTLTLHFLISTMSFLFMFGEIEFLVFILWWVTIICQILFGDVVGVVWLRVFHGFALAMTAVLAVSVLSRHSQLRRLILCELGSWSLSLIEQLLRCCIREVLQGNDHSFRSHLFNILINTHFRLLYY